MSGEYAANLTLKEAYMRDLVPRMDIISQIADINDYSMPCFEPRDTNGYSGGHVWFKMEMPPETLEGAYTTNHIESLSWYQFEEYHSVTMPLLLDEINEDLRNAVARTDEWQKRAILRSVPCN